MGRHLLTLEGWRREELLELFARAEALEQRLKEGHCPPSLQGKVVALLFFESSTRTRTSFRLAARYLGAEVVEFDVAASAVVKGESLLDTVKTLRAMGVELVVVRHATSGVPEFLAQRLGGEIAIVNAGDGRHAHPTQALLDLFTLNRHLASRGSRWEALRIAIVGDLLHSRVARSLAHGLRIMGTGEIRFIGPRTLVPERLAWALGGTAHTSLEALKGVDAVYLLRLQRERMEQDDLPSTQEYARFFQLAPHHLPLLKPGAVVLHPGPVNRGVEIASGLVDAPFSLIWQQVTSGIAVRMALLERLLVSSPLERSVRVGSSTSGSSP